MKITIFTLSLFISVYSNAQVSIQAASATDSLIILKNQLANLQNSVETIKQNLEAIPAAGAARATSVRSTINDIEKRQMESVRICANFNTLFAAGTASVDVILSSLETGVTLGQTSSPFISPTIRDKYDSWVDKWGKFLPAVILPLASLVSKDQNLKVGSVSVGIGLTALINAISKSDSKKNNDFKTSINAITETMDLFDFNRTVYSDIEKLKSVIKSVKDADSTLTNEYHIYYLANKDIAIKSDTDLKEDPRYSKFIENTTIYFDRFQLKLARVNYVLDYAEGMLKSYKLRVITTPSIPQVTSSTQYKSVKHDTEKAVKDLDIVFQKYKKDWNTLQGRYYKLSPTDTRKLELFSELEEIKKSLN